MLSPAKLEAYRRMSPRERWREAIISMEVGWRTLQALPTAEREHRQDQG